MAKQIRFDLPINGKKVKTLDELCDNMTIEILDHYRTGLLSKWLEVRGHTQELTALEQISDTNDSALLKAICKIFDLYIDDFIIAVLLAKEVPSNNHRSISSLNTGLVLKELLWQAFMCAPITFSSGLVNGDMLSDVVAKIKNQKPLKGKNIFDSTAFSAFSHHPSNGDYIGFRKIGGDSIISKGEPIAWYKMEDNKAGHFDGAYEFSKTCFESWLKSASNSYKGTFMGQILEEISGISENEVKK